MPSFDKRFCAPFLLLLLFIAILRYVRLPFMSTPLLRRAYGS